MCYPATVYGRGVRHSVQQPELSLASVYDGLCWRDATDEHPYFRRYQYADTNVYGGGNRDVYADSAYGNRYTSYGYTTSSDGNAIACYIYADDGSYVNGNGSPE